MEEQCAMPGPDDFELSLELSIGGGRYGDPRSKPTENADLGISRSAGEDLRRRKEIQALRRQEARRKRLKKSRKNDSFDAGEMEKIRKIEKGGAGGDAINDGLSLSLFTENKTAIQGICREWLNPEVQSLSSPNPNPSSSSGVSDYQTKSQKGGSSTDTGSHSSPLRALRRYHSHRLETNNTSEPAKSTPPPPLRASPGPVNAGSVSGFPGPVKPVQMPCVTATGNGPDGRTVRGFLYKYSKSEVSIACVCHGSSFSPAGFVEHAGGVGVSNPLRHITVVRSTFG